MVDISKVRILVVGAHPDDADTFAGCSAIKWASRGARVRFLSLCDGSKGWHLVPNDGIAEIRRRESFEAAKVYGLDAYDIWDVPDCELEPTIELRKRLTRYVRAFSPHVVLTHRLCDYHADHRACSQLVQDVSYMLGLPNWCPEASVPEVRPSVFFMTDDFDYPRVIRPDAVVAVDDVMDKYLDGLACHESQFFKFLPIDMGIDPTEVPSCADRTAVRAYLAKWHATAKRKDVSRFRDRVEAWCGAVNLPHNVEVFEMSRYGRQLSENGVRELFAF